MVEAGRRFGIPLSGTMAHSWVMAFPDEGLAFRRYAEVFGDRSVFLLDTYDTIEAAKWVAASGLRPHAVRLDSGPIVPLSRSVREILDGGGLRDTQIFVSGDLDEWRIAEIVAAGAPVDGFGVGTSLSTSSDAPAMSGVYKLVEVQRGDAATPVLKLSPGKQTYPGRKQVWRMCEHDVAVRDVIGLTGEAGPPAGQPLLRRVMVNGRRIQGAESLEAVRARCRAAVGQLPSAVRQLRQPAVYEVELSANLQRLAGTLSTI